MTKQSFIALAFILLFSTGAGQLSAAPRTRERSPSPLSDSMRKVRKTPSPAARDAFRAFAKKQGKGWKVRYNPRTALPEALTGGRTARYPGTPEQAAAAFFEDNKELLKVAPAELRLATKKEFMGITHMQYQQYKDGLPVEFSYARVHVTGNGEVSGYQGKFEPEISVNTTPGISREAAVMAAIADAGRQLNISAAQLVIFPDEKDGAHKLAWKIRGRGKGLWVYYVNAADGTVLMKYDDLRYVNTSGASTGKVYAISPLPDYNINSLNLDEVNDWTPPVTMPLQDQYFWVGGTSSTTVTNSLGQYSTAQQGKVVSSLKGPYFAVTNFRGASAHFDNGGGQWRIFSNPLQTPHPYSDSQTYTYSVNITSAIPAGEVFAKAMPRFSSFDAGALDTSGSINDSDQVYVKYGNSVQGAYIGRRTASFYGAAVESSTYTITLETDEAGTANGFTVDISSYLVLTSLPGTSDNGTGSVLWSTSTASVYIDQSLGSANGLSEINAFYHLNAIHRYFDGINMNPSAGNAAAADLSRQVPVMIHAHGTADSIGTDNGMMNAYYDLEKDYIVIGDGQRDAYDKYRSFALDGTIVRHEYIHLVMARIYPIINFGEFGAVSEGVSDYFALASFWRDYPAQVTLGNFVGAGEGASRTLSADTVNCGGDGNCVMPDDWMGEVHQDSLMLSQALFKLRTSTPSASARDLGFFTVAPFAGQPKADVLAYAALFYFPDNYTNFYEAMMDACAQFNTGAWFGQCDAAARGKIDSAFDLHGIGPARLGGGDSYEASSTSGLCDNNNGPECAYDLGSISAISATIYPMADVDYYSVPLPAGNFTARLDLPSTTSEGIYHAYSLFIFDAKRQYVTEAEPAIYGTGSDACNDSGPCYTLSPSVTLSYAVPYGGGRYYLAVTAAPNQWYGNSEANSSSPYSLTLSRSQQGSAGARLEAAVFDRDEIAFDVPYPDFPMSGSLSSSTLSGAELVFEYAQLRDHNYKPIELTRTNDASSYLEKVAAAFNTFNTDAQGRYLLHGHVKLKAGFSARYPGFGTVYLEVFGRNHLGHVLSLGISNSINLSADKSDVTAYNNIITSAGGTAVIKYETQSAGNLSVKVYTQTGTLVRTVYDGAIPAGKGTLEWDGTNSGGGRAASGIYFVKTKGPGLDKIVKIAIVR